MVVGRATHPIREHDSTVPVVTALCWLLLIHGLLWTWVGVSSRSNLDTPGDMVEAYVWAQGWQWGYYKHPPLSAWVAGLWFSVVPESHIGYSSLAAFNSVVGLAGLAFLAREFLPRHWVLLVVAAASLTPGFSSLALRFNCNAILISTWPWALALFVRLMQRGGYRDAVLCGVACALAMLGKYYSGVLLVTLLCAALWLPAWRLRLRTPAVALAVATFALCMAPHALWLAAQSEGPLQYAQAAAGQQSPGDSLMRAFSFLLAQCVFPVFAWVVFALALTGPQRARGVWQAATAPLRPSTDGVWLLAVLPIVFTMLGTVMTGARTASVWGLPISAGLALLAAHRAHAAGARLSVPRLWRAMACMWLTVAVLSPAWWYSRAMLQTPSESEPREELASTLTALWSAEHGGSLPWVSGTRALAASISFYAAGQPRYWSLWNSAVETPWVDTSQVLRSGAVIVCDLVDTPCQALGGSWSADRRELSVAKRVRGFEFEPRSYVLFVVSPVTPGLAP